MQGGWNFICVAHNEAKIPIVKSKITQWCMVSRSGCWPQLPGPECPVLSPTRVWAARLAVPLALPFPQLLMTQLPASSSILCCGGACPLVPSLESWSVLCAPQFYHCYVLQDIIIMTQLHCRFLASAACPDFSAQTKTSAGCLHLEHHSVLDVWCSHIFDEILKCVSRVEWRK